jgi:TRAP-type C4-dicarboxylate transport system permease small subunit
VSHAFDAASAAAEPEHRAARARLPGPLAAIESAMGGLNRAILLLGGIALVAACLVLSYSVVVRYLLKVPTEWQDETAVFLIVGATFLSAAGVQARRGHVAILLSPRANRIRLIVADVVSLGFVAFFAWKSWTLLHEAWVDGQISQSTWGPPLWIPYSLMALGMTLLALQFLLQIAEALARGPAAAGFADPKVGLGPDLVRAKKQDTKDSAR